MKLIIINGPNLNLIGKREPGIYGSESLDKYLESLVSKFKEHQIQSFQSNSEGVLIDKIQACEGVYEGIILNAGAYSHTSVAIADAIAAITVPVVSVHISNIFGREEFRHRDLIAPFCRGMISGLGLRGYELAIRSFS